MQARVGEVAAELECPAQANGGIGVAAGGVQPHAFVESASGSTPAIMPLPAAGVAT
jgi:hypothetical protein